MTSPDRATDPATDPYTWLEDVEGEAPLEWVNLRNAESEAALRTPRFTQMREEIRQVLDSDDRIPAVVQREDHLYNFWTDAEHQRGVWRRTTWESYRRAQPEWEVLVDVDELNAAEGANWVWHGATVLRPGCERALVSLSRGGADADVTREFDLRTRTFLPDGFTREESKGSMGWADETGDVVFVATDVGPGSMTTSGYPRTVRRWRRGEPLEAATEIFAGEPEDMVVGAGHDRTPGYERDFVVRHRAFYDSEVYLLGADDELTLVDVPRSAEVGIKRDWLTVELREEWTVGEATYPGGSLLGIGLERFLSGDRDFTVLFEPTPTSSLVGATWTRHHLVVNVLQDVANQLHVLTPPPAPGVGTWGRRPLELPQLPTLSTVDVGAVDPDDTDALWLTTSGYLSPTTLSRVDLDRDGRVSRVEPLKTTPALFDAGDLAVEQHFATSADGTRVPYFQVGPRGEHRRPGPTLLWGYGGFEIPLLPSYSGIIGRAWLQRGGTYVVANIRGGGEYGPRWHRAALKEKRNRAYEDFAAVARDLVARGVTTVPQLGTQGRSNGGLLVGNMLTQYPELFGAVVCQVPLLDMRRYSHLLAGASWMAEYGDPDDAAQWEFIRTFSPYHLVDPDREYPPLLLTTSTRDDRVHPGHARKMAALMLEAGKDVTYYENLEGGHAGSSDNAQRAHMEALAFEFLWQRLAHH